MQQPYYGQPPQAPSMGGMMPPQHQQMPPHRDHEAQPLLYQNQPSNAPNAANPYNSAYSAPPAMHDASRISGTQWVQQHVPFLNAQNKQAALIVFSCFLLAGFFALGASAFLSYWEINLYLANQDASCEQNIPLWLYISGITRAGITAMICIWLLQSFCRKDQILTNDGFNLGWLPACLLLPLLFYFVWHVLGSVWTYGIDRSSSPQCPAAVLDYTYYYLSVVWGVTGFALLCFGCIVVGARR